MTSGRRTRRRGLIGLGILLAIAVAPRSPARAAKSAGPAAAVVTAQGLRRAIFDLEQGRVIVNLPDDLAGGDLVTGTVLEEPAGKSEKELRRNAEVLEAMVVKFDTAATPVRARVLKLTIPAVLGGGTIQAILTDGKGAELARVGIPVLKPPTYPTHPPNPGPLDFMVPALGQAGAPIEMVGPFDGDFATTALRVGGQEARELAESPRKFIAESPRGTPGRTRLELTEGPVSVAVDFRNLSQTLTARKTELLPDEATVLTDTIRGLDGLEGPITIRLENRTANLVRLEGGDAQAVAISPDHVEPGGVMTIARTITGIRPGPFKIDAAVVAEPLGRDAWHLLKGLARGAVDLGALLDAAAKDLDAYAALGGTTPEQAAAITTGLDGCKRIAGADLADARRCADLALRPVEAVRIAAALWPGGFALYRTTLKLMLDRLAGDRQTIPWDLLGGTLGLLSEGAQTAGDAEGAKLLGDTKRLADYVKQGRAPVEKLKEVLGLMVEYRPKAPAGPAATPGSSPAPGPAATPKPTS